MKKRDRQKDGEEQRELLTLNEPLVPTMHETNYALGLHGISTNKLPLMLKLGNGDQNIVKKIVWDKPGVQLRSFEKSLTKTDLQDDCLHSPKENGSLLIMKPFQRPSIF